MIASVKFGPLPVSRLILGSNPFSGFSHQTVARDQEMRHYFTAARVKATLHQAESLGITTLCARADHHVMRLLLEYWDEGGKLDWLAQTCPELGTIERGVQNAIHGGAKACYVHGGVMDNLLANGGLDEAARAIDTIRSAGLAAGVAGHNHRVFEWAEEHLDVDFYMCCYYNPTPRDKEAAHVHGAAEAFLEEDRQRMVTTIARLRKPAIHYKVMAAGRNDPRAALAFTARHLRPNDAVCIGVFPKDNPDMLAEDARILVEELAGLTTAQPADEAARATGSYSHQDRD
jgi:hypothetical protein